MAFSDAEQYSGPWLVSQGREEAAGHRSAGRPAGTPMTALTVAEQLRAELLIRTEIRPARLPGSLARHPPARHPQLVKARHGAVRHGAAQHWAAQHGAARRVHTCGHRGRRNWARSRGLFSPAVSVSAMASGHRADPIASTDRIREGTS